MLSIVDTPCVNGLDWENLRLWWKLIGIHDLRYIFVLAQTGFLTGLSIILYTWDVDWNVVLGLLGRIGRVFPRALSRLGLPTLVLQHSSNCPVNMFVTLFMDQPSLYHRCRGDVNFIPFDCIIYGCQNMILLVSGHPTGIQWHFHRPRFSKKQSHHSRRFLASLDP